MRIFVEINLTKHMKIKDLKLFIPKEKTLYTFLAGVITMFIVLSATMLLTDSICIPNKEYKNLQEYYNASESLINQVYEDIPDYMLDVLSETDAYENYERVKNSLYSKEQ